MIEAIIFDGEGVVFDSETIWDKGQHEFLGRRGIAYDRSRLKPLLTGRSLVEGVRVMQGLFGFAGDPEVLARERLEIVRTFFETEITFLEGFLTFHTQVRAFCKTCIATSLAPDLLSVVDRSLELSDLFSGKVFSLAHVGNKGKPEPDLFLFAARQLGSPVEHCLVIEDAPLGVEAAKRAGMRCVALTSTYKRELLTAADLVVDQFQEIDLNKL
jgi:beta-phosphoglucomutase-like phosphatase (HAD superfamily)